MLSEKSLPFLEDLKANNNRDWFLDNKKRYEEYKKEYHLLIQSFLEILKPQEVIEELNRQTEAIKDKVIITTGVGQHQMWAAQYYRYTLLV